MKVVTCESMMGLIQFKKIWRDPTVYGCINLLPNSPSSFQIPNENEFLNSIPNYKMIDLN